MINEDMIKALRCIASRSEAGGCHMDKYNRLHKDETQMYCNKRVAEPGEECEKIVCPYSQNSYGVCVSHGDLHAWLGDVANELEMILMRQMPMEPAASPQERTRAAVRTTGNKWAMENFKATHN